MSPLPFQRYSLARVRSCKQRHSNMADLSSLEPDCESLSSMKGFDDYVRRVRAVTRFENNLLEQCRQTICDAVWGESNPDISGIGVCPRFLINTYAYVSAADNHVRFLSDMSWKRESLSFWRS